jgi:hypothetical protein
MRRLGIVVVGLALVVGIVVGGMVGNPFDGRASAQPAAPNSYVRTTTSGSSPSGSLWNIRAECDPGDAATGGGFDVGNQELVVARASYPVLTDGVPTGWEVDAYRYQGGTIDSIVVYVTCLTSPTYAVGGIAELPAVAGTGTSGMGGATYAVLAGAAAGVLAFAVLATLSVRRWRVR